MGDIRTILIPRSLQFKHIAYHIDGLIVVNANVADQFLISVAFDSLNDSVVLERNKIILQGLVDVQLVLDDKQFLVIFILEELECMLHVSGVDDNVVVF